MRKHNNTKLYHEEKLRFFIALFILMLVFGAYIYFVSASVYHVVMRKEAGQEIAKASSHVSQLESEYIEAQHSVSSEIASQNGFEEAKNKIFIERTETSLVLSQSNDS